jgi:hypothetical protein
MRPDPVLERSHVECLTEEILVWCRERISETRRHRRD